MRHNDAGQGKRCSSPPKKRIGISVVAIYAFIFVVILGGFLLFASIASQAFGNSSAFEKIVKDGYTGTQEQWLASLVGEETDNDADSAYELAVKNGYTGSETEWIEVLVDIPIESVNASPYKLACENGFEGSLSEWLNQIADKPETLGLSEGEGEKTEYELACEYGYTGTFIEWLISLTHDRVFE